MSKIQQVTVPDMGDAADVSLVEILVAVGDQINIDDPMVTLEGDKASMEVPSPCAGTVTSIDCAMGDQVSVGSPLISVEATQAQPDTNTQQAPSTTPKDTKPDVVDTKAATDAGTTTTVPMPDLGGAEEVSVIEVHVQVGQTIAVDDPLVTLEGDKASMEVPSPYAGVIQAIHLKSGDQARQDSSIAEMTCSDPATAKAHATETTASTAPSTTATTSATPTPQHITTTKATTDTHHTASTGDVYASPSVRRLAHALEVNLNNISGTGRKGRITRDDLHQWLKSRLSTSATSTPMGMPAAPDIDFSQFGDIERKSLNKIKRLTGSHVHRSWITVPHVTQFDEADITEMEAFRKAHKEEAAAQGIKLTPIVFVMKAVVAALKQFPHFNASLSPSQDEVILKKYFNIGVAVDTPNGLVVPVIRDVAQKSLFQLSDELIKISKKARDKGLAPKDMQGGCFTISSLGGIGGTAFTPIVNVPEVAILGLSKASIKPVYQGKDFVPRLMMPMSLSYDHRVIDGADGARFTQCLAKHLGDIRTLLL